jgi:hypothetical protein
MAHPTVDNLRNFINANQLGTLRELPCWPGSPVGTAVSWMRAKYSGTDLLVEGSAHGVQIQYDAYSDPQQKELVLDQALGWNVSRDYFMFMTNSGAGGLNPSAPSPWKAHLGYDLKRYPSGFYLFLFGHNLQQASGGLALPGGQAMRVHAMALRIDITHASYEWFDPGTPMDSRGLGIEVSVRALDPLLMMLTMWIDQRYRAVESVSVRHYGVGAMRVVRRAGAQR